MARPSGGLAVMADRRTPADSGADFFPLHPWATRALCVHVLPELQMSAPPWRRTVWEPAAGQGHMVRPLSEFFGRVIPSDIHDYGAGYPQHDFLSPTPLVIHPDWIITNPPFRLFLEFAEQALDMSSGGIAIFSRLSVLEGQRRYVRLFRAHPPTVVAPFVERVPLAAGRLGTTSATAYAWFVWSGNTRDTRVRWIPPCRDVLRSDDDVTIGANNA